MRPPRLSAAPNREKSNQSHTYVLCCCALGDPCCFFFPSSTFITAVHCWLCLREDASSSCYKTSFDGGDWMKRLSVAKAIDVRYKLVATNPGRTCNNLPSSSNQWLTQDAWQWIRLYLAMSLNNMRRWKIPQCDNHHRCNEQQHMAKKPAELKGSKNCDSHKNDIWHLKLTILRF